MKIEIRGIPQFSVPFKIALVHAMVDCANAHYDAVCKSQAQIGPLRRALGTMSSFSIDYCQVDMTFRELDTLLKVCENPPHSLSPDQRALVMEFSMSGHRALRLSNEVSAGWNASYDNKA
jgi:hypothetical protein